MSETSSAPVEPEDLPRQVLAQVAAWRAQGAAVDPLACARLDALARRTACQQGATRALLEQRLSALLTAQQAQAARPVVAVPRGERSPSPLAALLASLSPAAELPNDPDRLAQPVDGGALAEPAAAPGDALSRPPEGSPTELKAVRYFRSTWQRLGVRQRLSQSQAQVPEKAGPLNTQRLLNQALQLMDEQAPDYLRHLVTQVEAWLWLEAASGMAPPERKAGKRG